MVNRQSYQNDLYNVSIKLRQHGIGVLYIHCCPNMPETTLHKKITCAILALSAQTCFYRKITYVMSWSAWASIVQSNIHTMQTMLAHSRQSSQCCHVRLRQHRTKKLLVKY